MATSELTIEVKVKPFFKKHKILHVIMYKIGLFRFTLEFSMNGKPLKVR